MSVWICLSCGGWSVGKLFEVLKVIFAFKVVHMVYKLITPDLNVILHLQIYPLSIKHSLKFSFHPSLRSVWIHNGHNGREQWHVLSGESIIMCANQDTLPDWDGCSVVNQEFAKYDWEIFFCGLWLRSGLRNLYRYFADLFLLWELSTIRNLL